MKATGIEVGSVTVKRVTLEDGRDPVMEVIRHEGRPASVVDRILREARQGKETVVAATGQATRTLLDVPYWPETECLERALRHYERSPDLLLSLGGESFLLFALQGGTVRNIVTAPKCAAGSGEFFTQQLQRLGLSVQEGLAASEKGRRVPLSGRCSVYFKSDATHKLNKGECSVEDIALSLSHDLADKIRRMIRSSRWSTESIVLAGGLTRNSKLIDLLRASLPGSDIQVLEASECVEAFGAALCARDNGSTHEGTRERQATSGVYKGVDAKLRPLSELVDQVDVRAQPSVAPSSLADDRAVLCVDAGSTTTKAALYCLESGRIAASCYLRTHGNPVRATKRCLESLIEQTKERAPTVVTAAVTGSGRQLVSLFLNNALSFNEILSHARAAAEVAPDVETVFEIGGQDSKYVGLVNGLPVDYAMNDGCSAGTGSFLEETIITDMGVDMADIAERALASAAPLAFGERCAAFINTDIRNALKQGARSDDVIAGLVYSVVRNYLSRVVGNRQVGDVLLLQGGVALNRAVALAVAAATERKVIVPPHPELMGCVGNGLIVRDMLAEGALTEDVIDLQELLTTEIKTKSTFQCKTCDNNCTIERIQVREKTFPFGGLCPKWELGRLPEDQRPAREGTDYFAQRHALLFEEYAAPQPENPRGRVGIPLALWSFDLYPLFTKFFSELGYESVLSPVTEAGQKLSASICYPCQIAAKGAGDLLDGDVDYVFVPHVVDGEKPAGTMESFFCVATGAIPTLLGTTYPAHRDRILSPQIGFSENLRRFSLKSVLSMSERLHATGKELKRAYERALAHQQQYERAYRALSAEALDQLGDAPTVVVVGKPYVTAARGVNLALPQKITRRGFHVLPCDMLPDDQEARTLNIWRYTQQAANAVSFANRRKNTYLCFVSCFSCGPDGIMLHRLRERMAGEIFCYLEIDSHTAHAGFETRIGAFLDLVEKRASRDG